MTDTGLQPAPARFARAARGQLVTRGGRSTGNSCAVPAIYLRVDTRSPTSPTLRRACIETCREPTA